MLKELFEKNPYIVINTDIDGFLCGMVLQKYFNCIIVGFSNSWDYVWLTPEYEKMVGADAIYKPVYIDLFVADPRVVCIEQHIIGYDEDHNKYIQSLKTKINPNLLQHKSFTCDYFHKYPFGTIHFLITLMEKEGIEVELPDMNSVPTEKMAKEKLKVGDIILRADDALFSSLGKYKSNTEQWWPYLQALSGNAQSLKCMIDYVKNQDPSQNYEVKKRTGKYLYEGFNCDIKRGDYLTVDGSYKNILDNDGTLKKGIIDFTKELEVIFNMPITVPLVFNTHIGTASTRKYTSDRTRLILADFKKLYSYAFIYGPHYTYGDNFSYTISMN